jgi:hypothetical protein
MPSERDRLIGFLDAFQAAERAGVEALVRWIAVCGDPRVRGGLRVIEARDRRHAALAEARLRALGGAPTAAVSPDLTRLCGMVADPALSDRSKVAMLAARVPEEAGPLARAADRIEADAETRALLETIDDEERLSLEWLRRMHGVLEGEVG